MPMAYEDWKKEFAAAGDEVIEAGRKLGLVAAKAVDLEGASSPHEILGFINGEEARIQSALDKIARSLE